MLLTPDQSTELFRYDYFGSGGPGPEWEDGVSLQRVDEGTWSTPAMFDQHYNVEVGVNFTPGYKTDGTTFP